MPVDELDERALAAYLSRHVPELGEFASLRKFKDGQSNPTFLLNAANGRFVLRKQPPGKLLKSAHAVDREYRVMQALADTAVPVPRVLHLCDDPGVIDGKFFVMSFEDGRTFWDAALPELDNEGRSAVYAEMNRILAALHDVDVGAVGLDDYGRPGNYFARQTHRWSEQYRHSETTKIPAMDRLIEWLPLNLPPDDGQVSLIHGDYRLDNLMFHADRPEARAVLDWELSTLGHPYSDLAYQCMQLRLARDAVIPGLGGTDRAALGIPTEEQYVAAYCGARGLDGIPDWSFYLAFSFFRLAAILQGVMKRAIDGNASSTKALEYGGAASVLAGMGIAIVEQS